MSEKLGWGIIGCGVIGPSHAGAVKECEETELRAVCDVVEEKAGKMAEDYGGEPCTDLKDLLERDDIDCVSICTPSGMHAEHAIAAARAGKHVLCEKPIDISLASIDRLIQVCKAQQVKLGVIFQRRTYDATRIAREAVQGGTLGQMVLGDACLKYYRSPEYYKSAGWRGTWALDGGGALMNQGVHGVDQLLYIMGDVESVFARADHLVRDIEVEDTSVACLKYKSGAFGAIVCTTSVNPGEGTRIELNGNLGTIILCDQEFTKWAVSDSPSKRGENDESKCGKPESQGVGDPTAISQKGHAAQVADLVRAIREDRDPMVTGESARKSVELILAIYESARTGKEIKLPL